MTDQIDTIHGDLPTTTSLVPFAPIPMGEDRPEFGGFGFDAPGGAFGPGSNGITITGLEAHAAVRMHVTPATGAFWSYDHKCPKRMATTSSAGRLRTS